MIPGIVIKTETARTVVAFGDCQDGLYWVEPMRFLYPSEAKKEAQAKFSKKLLGHNNSRDWLLRGVQK